MKRRMTWIAKVSLVGLAALAGLAGAQAESGVFTRSPDGLAAPEQLAAGYTQITFILMVDLAPGTYAAVCFIPDLETGAPHAMLGMTASFTVTAP